MRRSLFALALSTDQLTARLACIVTLRPLLIFPISQSCSADYRS